jgi:carbonic anhydrase/acetyltransferase-like protein (isoleucine patch superfamily)
MALEGNGFGDSPEVAASAYVHPQATVIGNVVIGERVLVCPHAVIRADEPGPDGTVQPIRIGDEVNIQDTAVVHALGGSEVRIGEGASLAHGAVIHGPCDVGAHCFVGFASVVFKATLGDGVTVMHQALIEGVDLPPGLLVPSMTGVLCEEDVSRLSQVTPETVAFVRKVRHANLRLLEARTAARP